METLSQVLATLKKHAVEDHDNFVEMTASENHTTLTNEWYSKQIISLQEIMAQ